MFKILVMLFTAVRAKSLDIFKMLVISVVTLKYLVAVRAFVERNGLGCSALGAGISFNAGFLGSGFGRYNAVVPAVFFKLVELI